MALFSSQGDEWKRMTKDMSTTPLHRVEHKDPCMLEHIYGTTTCYRLRKATAPPTHNDGSCDGLGHAKRAPGQCRPTTPTPERQFRKGRAAPCQPAPAEGKECQWPRRGVARVANAPADNVERLWPSKGIKIVSDRGHTSTPNLLVWAPTMQTEAPMRRGLAQTGHFNRSTFTIA